MSSIFRVTDKAASQRAHGYPILGWFSTDHPLTASVGHCTFTPPTEPQGVTVPAPEELDEFIEERLPRYTRGVAVTDAAQIRRRLAVLREVKTRAQYRRALEALALPVEWLPAGPVRDAVAAEKDALWPWGAEGEAIDRAHERVEAQRARDAAEEAEAARIAALPNLLPDHAFGQARVFIPTGTSAGSWPTWLGLQEFGFAPDEASTLRCSVPVEGGHLFAVQLPDAGLEWGDGPIPGTSCSLVTAYVPRVAPRAGKVAMRRDRELLSCRGADKSPITVFRDGRTAEGEHAEKLARAWLQPRIAKMTGSDAWTWKRLYCQVTVRGLSMLPALAKHIFEDMVGPAGEKLERMLPEAVTGTDAWVSPDELYEPPAPKFVEKFVGFFENDEPWRAVIEGVTPLAVGGRQVIPTADIESALASAGLVKTRTPSNADNRRVDRLMSDWDKKKVSIAGVRVPAWVKS